MSMLSRFAAWLIRSRSAIDIVIGAIVAGVIAAMLFGQPAGAQLLTASGMVNTVCDPTPRVPPLPVPPVAVPAAGDMPGAMTVSSSSTIPTPAELPAQTGGAGTRALVDFNAKGVAVGWWLAKVGSVRLYLYGATWEHLAKNPGLVARLLLLVANPSPSSATVAAIGAAYPPTLNMLDMCDVWNPLAAPLNTIRPAPLPAQPVWTALGTVIYKFTGGRVSAVTSRKATKGAACDGTTKATVGLTVLQSLVGGPADEVTACTR